METMLRLKRITGYRLQPYISPIHQISIKNIQNNHHFRVSFISQSKFTTSRLSTGPVGIYWGLARVSAFAKFGD